MEVGTNTGRYQNTSISSSHTLLAGTMFVKRLFGTALHPCSATVALYTYLVGTAYMIADVFTKTQATRAMFFTCCDYMLNASNGPGFAVRLPGCGASSSRPCVGQA